jgi:2-polyprenyl-3-methyl-5-hydroxy-6-metoxy-1,4-benzoquinol methylase
MATTEDFVGQAVGDVGAALSVAMLRVGDRLGLYRALAADGPQTPAELAARTGTRAPLVAAWLGNQAAGDWLRYDPGTGRYELPAGHAPVLADPDSPVYFGGLAEVVTSIYADTERVVAAFRGERELPWTEHDERLFSGTERFFRPGYAANLVDGWVPALVGVEDVLRRGGRAADVGCGHGVSTILLAQAFPRSTFAGSDSHGPSVERARKLAAEAGVSATASFEVAAADELTGGPYDLVCVFDALHDMGHPVEVLAHLRGQLAPGGTVMLVEPYANDRVEDNLTPVGRVFYAASAAVCTPGGLSQHGEPLGAQAGPARTLAAARQAGFSGGRMATSTPFNAVYELTR